MSVEYCLVCHKCKECCSAATSRTAGCEISWGDGSVVAAFIIAHKPCKDIEILTEYDLEMFDEPYIEFDNRRMKDIYNPSTH